MDLALRRAGRHDFSDRSFVEPLKRLLDAYERESDLSRFGRRAVHFDVLRCLANLLRLDEAEEADPSITGRVIEAPIFITGLPRSATTFLHTLLAQDPAHAVPRSWQSMYPYPSKVLGLDLRRLEVDAEFALFRLFSPGVSALHPIAADTPQECTDITAQVFQSLRFDTTHRIPSYQSWLDGHGHHAAFRFHRRFLRHLDAQAPGKRWVLKSPDNVFALDAIRAAYPDARIVFLHRDPLSVVASCVKLAELLRKPFTRHIDRGELGDQVCTRLVESTDAMADAARRDPAILHLHYRRIVAQPMEAVRMLYDHCGLVLSREADARMRHWLETPRRHRHPRYHLEAFGLSARDLNRRFARYMQAFHVMPEAGTPRVHEGRLH
ncbi:MAG TPA: sulfotransferase [Rhizomicrobium sp.]|nr:sulfotransferase [Rhizomicrobium sp.]